MLLLTPVRGIKCIPPRDVWLISSGGIPKSSDQDTSPRPPVKSHPGVALTRVSWSCRVLQSQLPHSVRQSRTSPHRPHSPANTHTLVLHCIIYTRGTTTLKVGKAITRIFELTFPPFSFPFSFSFSLLCFYVCFPSPLPPFFPFSCVRSTTSQIQLWESAVSSISRVWDGVTAKIEYSAF